LSADLELGGTGVTFGGGLQYFLNPKVAIDLGLLWTRGKFDEAKLDGESVEVTEANALTGTRVLLGISFWPIGGRSNGPTVVSPGRERSVSPRH